MPRSSTSAIRRPTTRCCEAEELASIMASASLQHVAAEPPSAALSNTPQRPTKEASEVTTMALTITADQATASLTGNLTEAAVHHYKEALAVLWIHPTAYAKLHRNADDTFTAELTLQGELLLAMPVIVEMCATHEQSPGPQLVQLDLPCRGWGFLDVVAIAADPEYVKVCSNASFEYVKDCLEVASFLHSGKIICSFAEPFKAMCKRVAAIRPTKDTWLEDLTAMKEIQTLPMDICGELVHELPFEKVVQLPANLMVAWLNFGKVEKLELTHMSMGIPELSKLQMCLAMQPMRGLRELYLRAELEFAKDTCLFCKRHVFMCLCTSMDPVVCQCVKCQQASNWLATLGHVLAYFSSLAVLHVCDTKLQPSCVGELLQALLGVSDTLEVLGLQGSCALRDGWSAKTVHLLLCGISSTFGPKLLQVDARDNFWEEPVVELPGVEVLTNGDDAGLLVDE